MLEHTRKGAFYYKISHEVDAIEKIRKMYEVPAAETDALVMNMLNEHRRMHIPNQGRLFEPERQ